MIRVGIFTDTMDRSAMGTALYTRKLVEGLIALSDEKGIKLGDDALDYLLDQVVEMLMHSGNVDEVYAADVELRRKMAPVFKKHMAVDSSVDTEVRGQLRHLREGTRDWEVEYARVLDQVKRRKGL